MIILERAQFMRQYPEIAAATFLAQEQLVVYISSESSSQSETFYVPDSEADHLLVIAKHDMSISHSMGQKKASFWALEGVALRVLCSQAKPNCEIQIYCYGAARSSIQIDMLVRDSEQNSCAQNSHDRIALSLYPRGPHAHIRVRGAYLLKAEQSVQISVLQKHAVPSTTTDVVIKGIVQDKAQAHYEGLIFIDKSAPHTHARQENKNIILGAHAVADSRPTLEVLNHEVSCAHGSAVGQLDADQLFYLTSRGLDPECAQELLLDGFIGDLFDQTALSILGEIKTGAIKT